MADNQVTASPALPWPLMPKTLADFMAMFARLLPSNYLGPMQQGSGDGYELFEALGAVGARVSTAIARMAAQAYIGSATGGSFATAPVEFHRPNPIPDGVTTVTVQAGSVVECSASGRLFVLLQDVTFGPDDLGPIAATVQAVEQSYEYNVLGPRTAADGTAIPGEIDTCYLLRENPAYGDATIQVAQTGDASGGVPPALDQLGADLDLPRHAGEGDTDYRARLKQLPDTVSPGAIRRAAAAAFAPWGHGFSFEETWQLAAFYDADPTQAPAQGYNIPDGDVPPFANRWLDSQIARAAFIVGVEELGCVLMPGCAFNDPDVGTYPFTSPDTGGTRAVPAYNVDPEDFAAVFNGHDDQRDVVYAALWDTLQAIKAAGVIVLYELEGQ